tara:strand:+ start:2709 stop:2840 length:132 start_codon:yes stop_codon:yes gene_type:complete
MKRNDIKKFAEACEAFVNEIEIHVETDEEYGRRVSRILESESE